MNFSEVFKQTSLMCHFSPDGEKLASCLLFRLVIRDVASLQILQIYQCVDAIQYVEWSRDSEFILCAMYKRGLVQVWSLERPDWTCKIDQGSTGLLAAQFSPDSRHVLTTSDFYLRVTLWSLVNKSVSYFKFPKRAAPGLDFTDSGELLALAERRDCHDYVSVFDCESWSLLSHFETNTTDLVGIKWSPRRKVLAVWDSLLEYRFSLYDLKGSLLSSFVAYDNSLGIKSLQWSPSNQFIGIGSYDEKLRLMNHLTGQCVISFSHTSLLTPSDKLLVYREVQQKAAYIRDTEAPPATRWDIVEGGGAVEVVSSPWDPDLPNPKVGVGLLAFSSDSRWMATRNDNQPACVWLWDVCGLELRSAMLCVDGVRCLAWNPRVSQLAVCCGSERLYLWSPSNCVSVVSPLNPRFNVLSIKWHPLGEAILLIGREHMSICNISSEKYG